MKSIKLITLTIILSTANLAHSAKYYETSTQKITTAEQSLYYQALNSLNDWTGEDYKLKTAKSAIDTFIKNNPNFAPIYIEKSRLLIMTGATRGQDFKDGNIQALAILNTLQKEVPSYPKSYVLAGHAYTNIGDYSSAEKALKKAEILKPDDPWLYLNLATLMERKGETDKISKYAQKSLLSKNINTKSATVAIEYISKYGNIYEKNDTYRSFTNIVFSNLKSPKERLRLAERLISSYRGNGEVLNYANSIISQQEKESPGLQQTKLIFAKLVLESGFMFCKNHIRLYDERSLIEAEKILSKLNSKELSEEVTSLQIGMSLSRKDHTTANKLLSNLERISNKNNNYYYWKFLIEFTQDKYGDSLKTIDELSTKDPIYAATIKSDFFYYESDQDNLKNREEILKKAVYLNPNDAWTLGNYSAFLLYRRQNIDEAIKYGELALKEMSYGIAKNTTSIAYLVKSSQAIDSGKYESAKAFYNKAITIGFSEQYIQENCGIYCSAISSVLKTFSEKEKINL